MVISDKYEKLQKEYEDIQLASKIADYLLEKGLIRVRSEEEIRKKSILEYIREVISR